MTAPHPHSLADLTLAPVLIELERSLDELRRSQDLEYALALSLNDRAGDYRTAAQRAARIRRFAARDTDTHGWAVEPTSDRHGLAVSHGEYKVSLMFGRRLLGYIEDDEDSPAGSVAG